MRVSRSLTIKQMAIVAAVSMVMVFIFCFILLFHFVQQNRYTVATQLETVARSVREPLSAAILKGDIPQAEAVLSLMKPAGIVSRADVVLPNQFQALRKQFIDERPVPVAMTRLFELPVQISLPLYSLQRPANPKPLAYLVLQADSYRTYKFVISAISTLVTTYFLLVLMLTVALTWCISRFIVRPLRAIARDINDLPAQARLQHQLTLLRLHGDDEIGMLVRSYNRHQQILQRQYEALACDSHRYPLSELPNQAQLFSLLKQGVAKGQKMGLIMVACETLQRTSGIVTEAQREVLLLTLVEKIRSALPSHMLLAQISDHDFAILESDFVPPWDAVSLSERVLTLINERIALQDICLRPNASIGIAINDDAMSAEQFYQQACAAVAAAQRRGKNQIEFYAPELDEKVRYINR